MGNVSVHAVEESAWHTAFSMHSLSRWLFLLAILLKPFYILPSGSFQIGDICMVLSLAALIADKGLNFSVKKIDLLIVLFVMCVTIVELIYYLSNQNIIYLTMISYYLFNIFCIILFREHCSTAEETNFRLSFRRVLSFIMIIELAFYFTGIGRWYGLESSRYKGTFNDPNQLAFFIFASLVVESILRHQEGLSVFCIDDIFTGALIYLSASTGMLAGFIALMFIKIYFYIPGKKLFVGVLVLLCSFALVYVVFGDSITSASSTTSNYFAQRINQKISKADLINSESSTSSIINDRLLDKVVKHPDLMLFGAGEGDWNYLSDSTQGECHSTPVALLFYYGIGPFVLLLIWIINNLRRGDTYSVLLCCSLFVESLFLANQRQPLLWISIVAVGFSLSAKMSSTDKISPTSTLLPRTSNSIRIDKS